MVKPRGLQPRNCEFESRPDHHFSRLCGSFLNQNGCSIMSTSYAFSRLNVKYDCKQFLSSLIFGGQAAWVVIVSCTPSA